MYNLFNSVFEKTSIIMTLPAVIIGFIISTALGALFHLWRGGGATRLLLYMILSWIGFWSGHTLGRILGWDVGKLGPVYILFACLGSLLLLGIGYWLSLIEVERR
jgi:uncharacterized membrane protein YeaQ/YmgE (transglycosylase-associated protein family)